MHRNSLFLLLCSSWLKKPDHICSDIYYIYELTDRAYSHMWEGLSLTIFCLLEQEWSWTFDYLRFYMLWSALCLVLRENCPGSFFFIFYSFYFFKDNTNKEQIWHAGDVIVYRHRMNCLNANVEGSAYIVNRLHTNGKHGQLSDFIFWWWVYSYCIYRGAISHGTMSSLYSCLKTAEPFPVLAHTSISSCHKCQMISLWSDENF